MKKFATAHATHPQWEMATGLVLAQLRAQQALPEYSREASLGIVYFTDHYAPHARALLALLREQVPQVLHWTGTVGVGIAGSGVEYFDEPALAVMLCDLPPQSYQVFNGIAPLQSASGFQAHSALLHADGRTPDMSELLTELAARTSSGYLFGGVAASRVIAPQIAWRHGQAGDGVFEGGFSGVAMDASVAMISRVTQGCAPIRQSSGAAAKAHQITKSEGHVVIELDGAPALDVMLDELGISLQEPARATQRLRETLVGLSLSMPPASSKQHLGAEVRVRHLVGLDPLRRGIAIADFAPVGSSLTFCERNKEAARRDLMRICAEIREELEPQEDLDEYLYATNLVAVPASSTREDLLNVIQKQAKNGSKALPKQICGAIYVSCAGRGGPHFGGESAELQIVRHALGDVPLVGFFAGGEIAHQQLYGYTGVLTVFTSA